MTEDQRHSIPFSERRHEDRDAIIEVLKIELLYAVKEIIADAASRDHALSPEEAEWVRLAIKAEVERAALRKAIIEKTLTGLIWSAICVIGVYFWDHMTAYANYIRK